VAVRGILNAMTHRTPEATLLLGRIAAGLRDEDADNAAMWRDATFAERGRAIAELGSFAITVVASRGFPVDYGELEFPGLPRRDRAA